MICFKINETQSDIAIEYGIDDQKGIYLKIDYLTKHNDLFENRQCHLNVYTGRSDNGKKISKQEMEVYLKKYGISNKQINEFLHLPECFVCKKQTNSKCSQCHTVFYCSTKCKSLDVKVHKLFCSSLPFPTKIKEKNTVNGVLLSEYSQEPILVQVPIDYEKSESGFCLVSGSFRFFGEYPINRLYMQANPLKGSSLSDTLIFEYQKCPINNHSIHENKCVTHLTNKMNSFRWRGPILITKHKGLQNWAPFQNYLDIVIDDFSDIVDFFLSYS